MTVENSKAEQTVDDAAPHELALVRSLETASGIYLTQDDGGREGAGLALLAVVEFLAAKGLMPEHYSSIQRVALALRGLDNGEEIDPILKRRVTGRRKQRATLAIRGYIAAAMEAAIRFTSTNEQAAKWVADRIKGTPIAFQSRISTQTWAMVQKWREAAAQGSHVFPTSSEGPAPDLDAVILFETKQKLDQPGIDPERLALRMIDSAKINQPGFPK